MKPSFLFLSHRNYAKYKTDNHYLTGFSIFLIFCLKKFCLDLIHNDLNK